MYSLSVQRYRKKLIQDKKITMRGDTSENRWQGSGAHRNETKQNLKRFFWFF